ISTHSAHLIDALHAHTFHVRLVNGQTIVERAQTDAQRHRVCTDLGYRPSDIVQANCVIWVEGPSDRIYVRHWLKRLDEHFSEHGGLVWITAGREIENYVPPNTLSAAVERVALERGQAVKHGQFDKRLPSAKPNSKHTVDKVATALEVEKAGCGLQVLDLEER